MMVSYLFLISYIFDDQLMICELYSEVDIFSCEEVCCYLEVLY